MKTKFISVLAIFFTSFGLMAQEGSKPVFAVADKLNEFGEWQASKLLTVKGPESQITIGYRHKVVKKFALTCKFTVELKNDSDKKINFFYLAGNSRTDYYAGKVGAIKEKVKLAPGETISIDYPLPTANFKAENDAEICKKCKELEHLFFLGDLEVK
jgi:hypothetical protein